MVSSPKNNLVRAGLFHEDIQAAIKITQDFVKTSSGDEPSEAEIALSLKCSFILSEIKNQIDWQRQGAQKGNEAEFSLD
jgi:deoxyribose-phosphate aldolase